MNEEQDMKILKVILLITGLFLCLGIVPMWPFLYYVAVRVIVCTASVFAAVLLRQRRPELSGHFTALIMIAILFNPLIPANLSRLIWLPLSLGTAVYFLQLSKKL